MGSRIILSMAFGPRHVLMTSATVYRCSELSLLLYFFAHTFAAVIFDACAFLPDCLSGVESARVGHGADINYLDHLLITKTGICPGACMVVDARRRVSQFARSRAPCHVNYVLGNPDFSQ